MISVWKPFAHTVQPELQGLVDLTSIMGSDRFSSSLLDCLGRWVQSQHFSVLRMDKRQPQMLLAGTLHRDPDLVWRCWQAYARQFHQHDELYSQMLKTDQSRGALVGHLLAEDIEFAPYRQDIYLRNGMTERLSGLTWDDQQNPVFFNLYRHKEIGYFSDREIAAFEQLTPALIQIVRGHMALSSPRRSNANEQRSRLVRHAPTLTTKELEVCERLLQGMTHAGIAAQLNVKETTVKTYRNRAFARLGINFRSQLFALMQE
ncbi:MAG: LuxR C-terminal-related transcriptional regulator [Pseudomonas sp.]|uniref:helix-turn-helix transcriptional regulator n=1 Tax=Pseudomonas sp. TaxID=306 RepID=UPI0039820588